MAVPRGWCLHGYRCGAEKKGTGGRWRQEGDGMRGWEREEGTYVPTYRRGWCIAYYLCVVFVAALRAFFCSHRLLFISTNVQLYWSAIYHPHPAPPTPPMDFFPLFENVSGLYRGMEVCYDWPGVMEQPLMLHFVVPACHVILFCLLECRDWIFLQAFCFCTLRRYCMVKIWQYLFFCSAGAFRWERMPNTLLLLRAPRLRFDCSFWFMDISS